MNLMKFDMAKSFTNSDILFKRLSEHSIGLLNYLSQFLIGLVKN